VHQRVPAGLAHGQVRRGAALVADAHVILSSTIGGRAATVFAHPAAPPIVAADHVRDEVAEWLPKLPRSGSSTSACFWLYLAVALSVTECREVAVWSQDKDLSVSSLALLTTGDLLDLLARLE
jgi:hypothetical protein